MGGVCVGEGGEVSRECGGGGEYGVCVWGGEGGQVCDVYGTCISTAPCGACPASYCWWASTTRVTD